MTADVSPALLALLDLMSNADLWTGKRIEAARAIIEYEAPPEVFDLTYQFLMGVAEDPEQDVEWTLKALQLVRKVEARRVIPGTTRAADNGLAQALARRIAVARRRTELVQAGQWPAPDGWADDLLSGNLDAVAPESPDGLAKRLERARKGAA